MIKLPSIVQNKIKKPTFALKLKKLVSMLIELEILTKTIIAIRITKKNAANLKNIFIIKIFYNLFTKILQEHRV